MQNELRDCFLNENKLTEFSAQTVVWPFKLIASEAVKNAWRRELLKVFNRSNAIYRDAPSDSSVRNHDGHLDELLQEIELPNIVVAFA